MKNKPLITFGYNHLDVGHPDNPKNYRICGTKTRNPNTVNPICTRPAGWGTNHPGVGRCKLHGGSSLVGPESPRSKSLRYAHVWKGRLAEHFAQVQQDQSNPLDLLPELEVQRVMLSIALDNLAGAAKQPEPRQEAEINKIGSVEDDCDSDSDSIACESTMAGGGGIGQDSVDEDSMDIPRLEFSTFENPDVSHKSNMRLVKADDIELVRTLSADIVSTVAKVIAMRNQTALTKAEVTYLLSTLKEAIGLFVPKENQKAFVTYLMDKMPLGSIDETEKVD